MMDICWVIARRVFSILACGTLEAGRVAGVLGLLLVGSETAGAGSVPAGVDPSAWARVEAQFEHQQKHLSGTGEGGIVPVESAMLFPTPDMTAESSKLGRAVAVDGSTIVVGIVDDEIGADAGAALVFDRDAGGPGAWGQVAKLVAADGEAGDDFGCSVAISGDTVVVGACKEFGYYSGSAYIFDRHTGGSDAWGQVVKLLPPDWGEGNNYGVSVAISGDTAVVGARDDDDLGSLSGSAYIYERHLTGTDAWGQATKLLADDGNVGDRFGHAVAIDGDTVAIGAINDDDIDSYAGSAYLFGRDEGGAGAWGQVAKILAADGARSDYFGGSISISGDLLLIGSRYDDDNGSSSGSAYVYGRHNGGADVWGQATKLVAADGASGDTFGCSVGISGTTAVVGADGDDDGGSSSGSAYVFEQDQGGMGAWGQVMKLTDSSGAERDFFGNSVAISGDTAVIGAFGDDDNGADSGSAPVFDRDSGGADAWGQEATLSAPNVLTAKNDWFGIPVAADGDLVVAAARGDDDSESDAGAVYVFSRNHGGPEAWGQVAKLLASDGESGDEFGDAVSISGDTVVVGVPHDDDNGLYAGSAYIFDRHHGGPDAWGQVIKLLAPDGTGSDSFGEAVAISGDTVVVGAGGDSTGYTDDHGSVYVFDRNEGGPGAWGQVGRLYALTVREWDRFGHTLAISGDTLVVGACGNMTGIGCAHVFDRDPAGSGPWSHVVKIEASDGWQQDYFADSLSISGDTIVVGAWQGEAAYVYERHHGGANAWGEVVILHGSGSGYQDYFGGSVSISGDTVVVGASSYDVTGLHAGATYFFSRHSGGAEAWGEVFKLLASDGAPNDGFGGRVAIAESTVVVGASGNDDIGGASGSAYVYDLHQRPEVTVVGSTPPTASGALLPGEWSGFGFTDLSVSFTEPMADPVGQTDPGDVTNPANWMLVEAGTDRILQTTSCSGGVSGDDEIMSPDEFFYTDATRTVDIGMASGAPLSSGLYRIFACSTLESAAGLTLDGNGDGNPGDDFTLLFGVDEAAPLNPVVLPATHTVGEWSVDPMIQLTWSGASDQLSGVLGYSFVLDTGADTEPDTTVEIVHASDPHQAALDAIPDDAGWHFHLRTCDQVGNCTAAVHLGPFPIDTTAPDAVSNLISTSHASGSPSNQTAIDVEWTGAIDNLSGIQGYGIELESVAVWDCDEVEDLTGTTATLIAPAEGTWFVHVCAVDVAGNWGSVASAGPFEIDTTTPAVLSVGGEGGTVDGFLTENEAALVALTQLRVDFSEPIDPFGSDRGIADPTRYRVLELGSDGLLSTEDCEGDPVGDDVEVSIAGAWAWSDEETISLHLDQNTGAAVGRYALLICDAEDLAGNVLSATWVRLFAVDADNSLRNPNFDHGGGAEWDTACPNASDIRFLSVDPSTETSGIAAIDPVSGAGETFELTQCVEVFAGTPFALGGLALINSNFADAPTLKASVRFFRNAGCTDPMQTVEQVFAAGDTAWEWTPRLLFSVAAPLEALSARVGFVVDGGTADEFLIYLDEASFFVDTIFVDGFELGDTEWWTSATPRGGIR